MYKKVATKTSTVPGISMNVKSTLKRIGERYSNTPVDTAVAKHLITASASGDQNEHQSL